MGGEEKRVKSFDDVIDRNVALGRLLRRWEHDIKMGLGRNRIRGRVLD